MNATKDEDKDENDSMRDWLNDERPNFQSHRKRNLLVEVSSMPQLRLVIWKPSLRINVHHERLSSNDFQGHGHVSSETRDKVDQKNELSHCMDINGIANEGASGFSLDRFSLGLLSKAIASPTTLRLAKAKAVSLSTTLVIILFASSSTQSPSLYDCHFH